MKTLIIKIRKFYFNKYTVQTIGYNTLCTVFKNRTNRNKHLKTLVSCLNGRD